MEKYERLKAQLFEQLAVIPNETTLLFKQAALAIPICNEAVEQLKVLVNKNSFKTLEEEIFFFKHLKPEILARLIYHIQIYHIETRKPSGTEKQLKKYFENHLMVINEYKKEHILFYQYYRSEAVYLDEKYFTRSKSNLHLILDNYSFNYDTNFNTSHDHKVAQILAFDLLSDYLHKEWNKLERNLFSQIPNNAIPPESNLKWTDSKVALIELLYALHTNGCFNNGSLDLKELVQNVSEMFNIELKDFYRTWAEMKLRKEPTKFIDTLKICLESKIKVDLQ